MSAHGSTFASRNMNRHTDLPTGPVWVRGDGAGGRVSNSARANHHPVMQRSLHKQ